MSDSKNNSKENSSTSPQFAEENRGKPKRTQGLKIMLFTIAVLALVLFMVFNTIDDSQQQQKENENRPTGRISDSGRLRADLIAAASVRPTIESLPEPSPDLPPPPPPTQVIVVQPPQRPRRRVKQLSQEETAALRAYRSMAEDSLTSKSEVSGFGSFGSSSSSSNEPSQPPLTPEQQMMRDYMMMQAQNESQNGQGGNVPNLFMAQNSKLDFLTKEGAGQTPQGYSENTRKAPLSPMELKAGTVIPGMMLVGVNTDLPGAIIGQVSENVYDSATGHYLLIPQGTRIMGIYDARIVFGQSRVGIVWNRLIYPDGSSLNIAGSPGADMAGYSGMKGRVNNHYGHLLSAALFTGLFVTGAEIVSPSEENNSFDDTKSPKDTLKESVGLTITDIGAKMAERALEIPPTITLKPGTRFNVLVTQDIVFTYPWHSKSTQVAGF